jgi:DNA polymerase sigma
VCVFVCIFVQYYGWFLLNTWVFSPSEFIEQPELIQAKVPILKFHDTRFCLEVDLNCNNAVGIRNTHLLYCYSQSELLVRNLNVINLFLAILFI